MDTKQFINKEYRPLESEELHNCVLEAKEGNKEAEEKVFRAILPLIYKFTKGDDDLFQYAIVEIYAGIKNWDSEKDTKFSTYIVNYIRSAIYQHLGNGIIHLPDYLKRAMRKGVEHKYSKFGDIHYENITDYKNSLLFEESTVEKEVTQKDQMEKLIASLSERDIAIMNLRLEGKTYKEIGKHFNISRGRVEQIIRRIERKANEQ